MSSSGLLTTAGHALIAAKIAASANLTITTFKFANVNGLDPDTLPENYSQTEPTADLVHTMAVTRAGSINSDTVIYSAVLDSTVGDFNFNWIGLYDETDTLVMIKYTEMQYKTGDEFGGGNNLTRNFAIKFTGAATVTDITIPAESWQFDSTQSYLVVFVSVDITQRPFRKHRFMSPAELQLIDLPDGSEFIVSVDFSVDLGAGDCKLLAPEGEQIVLAKGSYDDVDITTRGVDFNLTRFEGEWRE